MNNGRLNSLQIAIGKLTPQRGTILCGVADCVPAQGWSLTGQIVGPYSSTASTLPATFAIRDLGPGDSVLAQGLVLDPVYWSPELPARYRVQVELRQQGEIVEQTERMFGIRWLAAEDGNLHWQGRRTVLRGVEFEATNLPLNESATRDWLAEELACLVVDPTDAVCEWASAAGVPVLADVSNIELSKLSDCLARLDQHASVIAAILKPSSTIDHEQIPPGLPMLLAADLRQQTKVDIPAWADVLVADERQLESDAAFDVVADHPVIVTAKRDGNQSPADIRSACDQLRAKLAAVRQCAGYVIELSSSWL